MSPGCPVCGAHDVAPFLERADVSVHQNLIMASVDDARRITRGTLSMHVCHACGFGFNADFDATLLSYGHDYDNTQSYSPAFKAYMAELVTLLVDTHGLQAARIVEVGCGKGHFLRQLVGARPSNVGWGFDPSYVGPETDLEGRLQFVREFYGAAHARIQADAVVCRHVIEHVADPVALLRTVRAAVGDASHTRVFFETPCLAWILRSKALWDLFYEHCSLFTADSLSTAFELAGFEVLDVRTIFGGQYLWLEARPAPADVTPRRAPGDTAALAASLAAEERRWIDSWVDRLRAAAHEKVAIWGAGAKGVTFANLIDPRSSLIDCVVDLNPRKQSKFLPGTGHPIVAPSELVTRGVTTAILMNPNYRAEIEALLESEGATIRLEDHS